MIFFWWFVASCIFAFGFMVGVGIGEQRGIDEVMRRQKKPGALSRAELFEYDDLRKN